MTTTEALLADLRSRGIELETDGHRLRWRPTFLVNPLLAERIRSHKTELISLLAKAAGVVSTCPACRWPLDSRGRCVKCFDRFCVDCGALTGSYFLLRCFPCGNAYSR